MTATARVYTPEFFDQIGGVSATSASVTVPLILNLFPDIRSVADVGCGAGVWLESFLKEGISTVRGFDGGGVQLSQLRIELFRSHGSCPSAGDRSTLRSHNFA